MGSISALFGTELLAWLFGLLCRFIGQLGCSVKVPVVPGAKAAATKAASLAACKEHVFVTYSAYVQHSTGVLLLATQLIAFVMVVSGTMFLVGEISVHRRNRRFNTEAKLSFDDMTSTKIIHLPKK